MFLQVDWNTGRTCSARQHRRLVHDALAYRKPVKLTKKWSGVGTTAFTQDCTSGIVLSTLQHSGGAGGRNTSASVTVTVNYMKKLEANTTTYNILLSSISCHHPKLDEIEKGSLPKGVYQLILRL